MRTAFVFLLFLIIALSGTVAPDQSEFPLADYNGTTHWSVSVSEDEGSCGGGVVINEYDIAINHMGRNAEIGDWGHGMMDGAFSGDTLTIPGRTIPDSGGTSRLSSLDLIFSSDCHSFSGGYDWHYSDQYTSCDGSTYLSGTRANWEDCPGTAPEETPAPEITPAPEETPAPEPAPSPTPKCAPVSSPCPLAVSGTQAQNPGIASGSECRGACGADCPSTCMQMPTQRECVSAGEGCNYMCTYAVQQCGTNEGCRKHDDCYDACAEQDELTLPLIGGLCHRNCDFGCVIGNGFSGVFCPLWLAGLPPYDSFITYSMLTSADGPFQECPLG
jgi:hypothetical protein